MDRDARFRALLAGAACAACRARVAPAGIRVLARRDDLAVIELTCAACDSVSIVFADAAPPSDMPIDADADADAAAAGYGEFGAADRARFEAASPIDEHDVAAVARFLAAYRGDLVSLVAGDPPAGWVG